MSNIINARSPFYIKYVPNNPSFPGSGFTQYGFVSIKIYIYAGTLGTDKPPASSPTYSMVKYPEIIPGTQGSTAGSGYIYIEISELIRDYLETEYYTEAIDAVWVEVDAELCDTTGEVINNQNDDFLAIDGYGDWHEGINPRTSIDPNATAGFTPMVLQSNTCIPFVRGRDIKIPVFSEPRPQASSSTVSDLIWNFAEEFWQSADTNWESSSTSIIVPDSNDSSDKIYYLIITTDNANTGDVITINSTVGTSQSVTLVLEEICNPKYEAYRSIFYNKFGALQSFWFPRKHTKKLDAKSSDYKTNTIDIGLGTFAYSQYKHSKRRFNVIGNESITLNTTLLNECLNNPIEQLLLAEQVWLEGDDLVVDPMIIKTTNQTKKIGVNNKVEIQYTFEFEYAYEKIQNVR